MSQTTLRTGLLSHPQYWRWLQMLMCLQIRRFLLWIEQHVCLGDAFLVPAQRRRLDRAVGFIESGFCITRESGVFTFNSWYFGWPKSRPVPTFWIVIRTLTRVDTVVVADSLVQCPWHLTKQFWRYVTKLPHVSASFG